MKNKCTADIYKTMITYLNMNHIPFEFIRNKAKIAFLLEKNKTSDMVVAETIHFLLTFVFDIIILNF